MINLSSPLMNLQPYQMKNSNLFILPPKKEKKFRIVILISKKFLCIFYHFSAGKPVSESNVVVDWAKKGAVTPV